MFTESCFEVVEAPVPEPGDGEALVQVEYLSLDPAMRGWVRDEPSYLPPVQIGEVMRSGGAGHVIASEEPGAPGRRRGDGHARVAGARGDRRFDPARMANALPDGVELRRFASLFGSTGVTAYFGVLDVGAAQAGRDVVVSGAAGGVGSIAGQIAKILGLPRGRVSRARREVQLGRRRARLRRVHRLQGRRRRRRRCRRVPERHRRVLRQCRRRHPRRRAREHERLRTARRVRDDLAATTTPSSLPGRST